MFTQQSFTPAPFGKITSTTHDEHLKLYAGYVKNANGISEQLGKLWTEDSEKNHYLMSELTRRFSFEYNGMRNHEVYFALTSGASPLTDGPLKQVIETSYGSVETFLEIFKSMAMIRGVGWAIAWYDKKEVRLLNSWVDEQHLGQLQDCTPIIALDMWEHAYVADYLPSGKKEYIADFFKNLNWNAAEAFFQAAQGTH